MMTEGRISGPGAAARSQPFPFSLFNLIFFNFWHGAREQSRSRTSCRDVRCALVLHRLVLHQGRDLGRGSVDGAELEDVQHQEAAIVSKTRLRPPPRVNRVSFHWVKQVGAEQTHSRCSMHFFTR